MEIFWVVVVIGAFVAAYVMTQKDKALQAAKEAYLKSLSDLKAAPTNADLKQQTLALGRVYSNLTRDRKGITVFEEVAVMNDINAACAAATAQSTSAPAPSVAANAEDRLRTLTDLKAKGLIDEMEYAKRKGEILSSI